jgi:penicillin-binding protein 1B
VTAGAPRPPSPTPRRARRSRIGWGRYLLGAFALLVLVVAGVLTYGYMAFSQMIDARLHGERERSLPRVYGRPMDIRRGQMFTEQDLVVRLNDLGYAQRATVTRPGEFAIIRNGVVLSPRSGEQAGKEIQILLPPRAAKATGPGLRAIREIDVSGEGKVERVRLDPPLLTGLMSSGARQKRRKVPLSVIPARMQRAVLAIEDQRFYSHWGINPVAALGAVYRRMFSESSAPVGSSTITQQLARMFFLADEFNAELQSGDRGRSLSSYVRKGKEAFMSLVLERRTSKDEIFELYLNDVYLGQRGSFAIHGVAEAARIFFGKDVSNISLAEAATIAGMIQSPASRSPFVNPKRAVERRNVVLRAMASEGAVTEMEAARAARDPLLVAERGVDNEAPYFVDLVAETVDELYPGVTAESAAVDVYTTLDLHLQRAAIDALRTGLARVDARLKGRKGQARRTAQAALVSVDPRTGEILALVGGRSYNQSQLNRAAAARRQPGSVFKPFVFLAAFEQAAKEGRTDITPASLTDDSPTTFTFNGETWEPKNYDEYDGEISFRRALARSRNLGTIHVGEEVGFGNVAALWRRVGVGEPPRGYPSITLGVFEITPLEVAEAYTLFLNDGSVRPLRSVDHLVAGGKSLTATDKAMRPVARPTTAYLVTNMMRSVLSEGTGAAARGMGFVHDAAGKSGTTNDQRDAWFVGFTPELLTVVWVGFDDNQPLGLTGSAAALPIWTEFMKAALAGRPSVPFKVPSGISFAEVDPESGKLSTPDCPESFNESFASGTEPTETCPLHGPLALQDALELVNEPR